MHPRFDGFSRKDAWRLFVVLFIVFVVSVPQMSFAQHVDTQDKKRISSSVDHRAFVTVKPNDSDVHYPGIVVEKRVYSKNSNYSAYTIATNYKHPYNVPCKKLVCKMVEQSNIRKLSPLLPSPSCTAKVHIVMNGKSHVYPADFVHERCSFEKSTLSKNAQFSFFSIVLKKNVPVVVAPKLSIDRIREALPKDYYPPRL